MSQEKNHTVKKSLLQERRSTKAHRRLVHKFDLFFFSFAVRIENVRLIWLYLFRALKIKSILKRRKLSENMFNRILFLLYMINASAVHV